MKARLYLITNRAEPVRAAIDGGVDMVQLRNKVLDDRAFLGLARRIAALCRERGVPFLLNDRVHLVLEAGADGVHVGADDMRPEEARERLGPELLLGISTHNRTELERAAGRGASYAGLGPVFPTKTKQLTRTPGRAALVRSTVGSTSLPVFLVGGIRAGNARSLIDAGATRLAVSSAVCDAPDPCAAAAELRAILPRL